MTQHSIASIPAVEPITGLLLAGGQGRRMGGVDKGLQTFNGEPLAAHVLRRLAPQVSTLLINANQNAEQYAAFGYPVIADISTGHLGPLAGLQAGLAACRTPLLLSVPCDSPLLPHDLAARLYAALRADDSEIAIAETVQADGTTQTHPVFCLCKQTLAADVSSYLENGGRKFMDWLSKHRLSVVRFGDATAFANINTPEELARMASHASPTCRR